MHASRPEALWVNCGTCGVRVDALRSVDARVVGDGLVHFCSRACAEGYGIRVGPAAVQDGHPRVPSATERTSRVRALQPQGAPASASQSLWRVPLWQGERRKNRYPLAMGSLAVALCAAVATWQWPWFRWVSVLGVATALVFSAVTEGRFRLDQVVRQGGVAVLTVAAAVTHPSHAALTCLGAVLAGAVLWFATWLDERNDDELDDVIRSVTRYRRPALEPIVRGSSFSAFAHKRFAADGVLQHPQESVRGEGAPFEVEAYPGAGWYELRRAGDRVLAGQKTLTDAEVVASRDPEGSALEQAVSPRDLGMETTVGRWAMDVHRGTWVFTAVFALVALVAGTSWVDRLTALGGVLMCATSGSAFPVISQLVRGGMAALFRRGVVVTSPGVLETLGAVRTVAFCTRGTVTTGSYGDGTVVTLRGASKGTLLGLVSAAQTASPGHPITAAVERLRRAEGAAQGSVHDATHIVGRGVSALTDRGEPLIVGNRRLLLERGVSVAEADQVAHTMETDGYSTLFVALGGQVQGVIGLRDMPRGGAERALQRVSDAGLRTALLSGDHVETVRAVGRRLGIGHVLGDLTPEEREAEARRMGDEGFTAVVGGTPRDDSPLGAADVPMVLNPWAGPEFGRGVGLWSGDLAQVHDALWVGRAVRSKAQQVLAAATAVCLLTTPVAALGFASPWLLSVIILVCYGWILPAAANTLRRVDRRVPLNAPGHSGRLSVV